MPKYIGPYEVIQLGENGPVYRPGDPVTGLSDAELTNLRDREGYRFEDDPPEAVSPVHALIESNLTVMPPDERGVSEVYQAEDDKEKKTSKKD